MAASYIAAGTWNDRNSYRAECDNVYSLLGGGPLMRKDSQIRVALLITAFEDANTTGKYDTVEIKPGLNANSELVFLLNFCNLSRHTRDSKYYVLNNTSYGTSLPTWTKAGDAADMHTEFLNNVLILDTAQKPGGIYRSARTVEWDQLMAMLSSVNGHTNPGNTNNYCFMFEQGYISETEAVSIMNDFGGVLPSGINSENMQGFTPIIYLLDENNDPVIQTGLGRSTVSYDYRIMSGGRPCPPHCP